MSYNGEVWGGGSGASSETWGNQASAAGVINRDTGGWGSAIEKTTSLSSGAAVADCGWGSTGGGKKEKRRGNTKTSYTGGGWGDEDEEVSKTTEEDKWGQSAGERRVGVSEDGYMRADAYDMDSIRIAPVTWRNEELDDVRGYDYEEHEAVQELSEEDVTAWRNSWHMNVESSDPYAAIPKPIRSFEESKLPEDILDLIDSSRGGAFENPTAIQSQGWPFIMTGKDVIGVAQTGSGKTLTFILPGVVHIRKNPRKRPKCPQVMIQAPTRELARQIGGEVKKYSKGINVGHSFGGEGRREQEAELKVAQFIVGTPGRTMDHIANHCLSLRYCTYIVLDEADRMLDMGFQPQIEKIFKCVRLRRQLLLFTATWPRSVHELASKLFQMEWLKVTIGALKTSANHNVDQRFLFIYGQQEKQKMLMELLQTEGFKGQKTLIFVRTRAVADEVCMFLRSNRISTAALHGGKDQRIRDIIVSDYKKGVRLRCLIATDVAQRGLHVNDISLVINFDYPNNVEDYVHRIGRTARSGTKGISITMFNMATDAKQIDDLVEVLKEARQPIPKEFRHGGQVLCIRGGHKRPDGVGRSRPDCQRICYDFQKGNCKRGSACRYLHEGSGEKGGGPSDRGKGGYGGR